MSMTYDGICFICLKLFLSMLCGFLWVLWLLSEVIEEDINNEYAQVGVSLCVLGVIIPLVVVITNLVIYKAMVLDSILGVFAIYLVIGLSSNLSIRGQYGSGFLPLQIKIK